MSRLELAVALRRLLANVRRKSLADALNERKSRLDLGRRQYWRHLAALRLPLGAAHEERIHREERVQILFQVHIVGGEAAKVVEQHAPHQVQRANDDGRIAELVEADVGGAGELSDNTEKQIDMISTLFRRTQLLCK